MKKIYKFIIAALLIFNISCSSDENDNYGEGYNSGWVEVVGYGEDEVFEYTINYDEGLFEIPIKLNSGTNVNGIEVTYSVELIDGNVDDSILGSKTFLIEKDAKESVISFEPTYSDSYYTLKFKLENTDDNQFLIGLSDGSKPIEFTLSVTNYKLYDANPTASGDNAPEYVTKVGRIDATHFSVESIWGPNFVAWATGDDTYMGAFANEGVLTLNPDDNTLTVTGDYVADTGSSGTFDPTTGILTFSFIQANLFGSEFQVDNVLTPQP